MIGTGRSISSIENVAKNRSDRDFFRYWGDRRPDQLRYYLFINSIWYFNVSVYNEMEVEIMSEINKISNLDAMYRHIEKYAVNY